MLSVWLLTQEDKGSGLVQQCRGDSRQVTVVQEGLHPVLMLANGDIQYLLWPFRAFFNL